MSTMINTIINFITKNPIEHVTAVSIIYKAIEVDPTMANDQLSQSLRNIIQTVINNHSIHPDYIRKLRKISTQVNKF
jgi:hypothetical protein